MKKKYNDLFQENVQLKTKLSHMKREIDKMDKLIKQGNKNYQKNAENDFQDIVDDEDVQGPSLRTLWQQKKHIKEIREEIEVLENEIKQAKHSVQNFKPLQAETNLAMLNRNLEHYKMKIHSLSRQQEREGEIQAENEVLRKEEVELAKRNNQLIQERDNLKGEVQKLQA